ncbi:universal stress protein [Rhodococcus sp. WMMA185]|uniref:universal stress protein n=1 Tax=Rhodococcus sp. WMMA185 TaxID=679318 RepID=UPI000878423A|nr:universal stress protein [Rhodococcus sp. WMMA185]AOW94773.1 universal stress protein [Rhodococcus sp. WMMA185]
MTTAQIRRGIVAGIDGSEGALEAAAWAASAARCFDEPLRLVHVLPKHPKTDDAIDEVDADFHPGVEKLLDAAEQAALDGYRNLTIERNIESGPPARTLVGLSKSARMVVLGPAATSEMRSVYVGSDVVRVSNNAECPVAVWRGIQGNQVRAGRPVVVGVDGSELSHMAVAHAFEFAAFFGAPLIAVHTWSEHSTLGAWYSEERRFTDWQPHAQQETALLAESLAGWSEKYPDVEVTRCVERGKPTRVLLEHSVDAQLMVVGSHGRTPFTASIIGSTSQSLIHHARCPVLICRKA